MKSLLQHREELAANPAAYTQDLERATNTTLVGHLKAAGYGSMTGKHGADERREFVRLIFHAQGERPFLHIEAALPYCWNSPNKRRGGYNDWRFNYIRYEWGHLLSKNQNQTAALHIENLCLMSARCNQHIQSSMNIEDLLTYGGALETVIKKNLRARRVLFSSVEWCALLERLEVYRGPHNTALQTDERRASVTA
jgi:hypothetical protein